MPSRSLGHEYALNIKSIAQLVDGELVEDRVTALLSGFFAALALLLASIGLYGDSCPTPSRAAPAKSAFVPP